MQWPLRLAYDHISVLILRGRQSSYRVRTARYTVSRFFAAFLSAWFSLRILNTKDLTLISKDSVPVRSRDDRRNDASTYRPGPETKAAIDVGNADHESLFARKTLDLTIPVAFRALDTVIVNLWRLSTAQAAGRPCSSSISIAVARYADTAVFALSSGIVMWAWFYLPNRLPRAYNQWINEAAQVDSRLIELLREARADRLIYGKNTGHASVLQGMCEDYGWPLIWGDPKKTVPIPCEVVHMGTGPSCHWHAAVRFSKAFKFALLRNLPLQLLIKARRPSPTAFKKACEAAIRSSAFLGAFVALVYYGICLSRTRLGPVLFSRKTITPMMWDSGLCVRVGCILCGWSILIESEKRRPELAMFVAPRALATFIPSEYDEKVCQVQSEPIRES